MRILDEIAIRWPVCYSIVMDVRDCLRDVCRYWRIWRDNSKPFDSLSVLRSSIVNAQGRHSRVAILTLYWESLGGAEAFALQCARELRLKGYEVHVIASRSSDGFYRGFRDIAESFLVLDQIDRGHLGAERICNLVNQVGAVLLHNHHCPEFYEAARRLRVDAVPIRIIDSLHIDERPWLGGGFPRLSIRYTAFIDYHHVISNRLRARLLRAGVLDEKIKVGTLLCGDQAKWVCPRIFQHAKKNKIKICFVGRLVRQKRPVLMLAMIHWAVAYGKARGVDVTARIVGDGDYSDRVGRYIAVHKLDERVEFVGACPSAVHIIADSDLLVLPSDNEGIALVLFESLACGCLPITTRVGAQGELIPDELLMPHQSYLALKAWKKLIKVVLSEDPGRAKFAVALEKQVLSFLAKPRFGDISHELWGRLE